MSILTADVFRARGWLSLLKGQANAKATVDSPDHLALPFQDDRMTTNEGTETTGTNRENNRAHEAENSEKHS